MDDGEATVSLTGSVSEGESRTFTYRDSIGLMVEGLVFRREGRLFAYRNQCRHQPLALDYGDGEFFSEDGQYLLCRNHGALFKPESGYCVSGPCIGASLFPLEVVEKDGSIQILIPPAPELDLEEKEKGQLTAWPPDFCDVPVIPTAMVAANRPLYAFPV